MENWVPEYPKVVLSSAWIPGGPNTRNAFCITDTLLSPCKPLGAGPMRMVRIISQVQLHLARAEVTYDKAESKLHNGRVYTRVI